MSYHKGVDRHYVGTREIFLESEDLTIEGSNTYVNTVNSVRPEIAHCKDKGMKVLTHTTRRRDTRYDVMLALKQQDQKLRRAKIEGLIL